MLKLQKLFTRMQNQKGAAKIEYVLLVALISVVAIAALTPLGETIGRGFNHVDTKLGTAGVPAAGGGSG